MTHFVQNFLMMSLQGALIIAALLFLRAVFEKRMAPTVLYALWLLPAARLLIPGSITSAFSFQNLIAPALSQKTDAAFYQPVFIASAPEPMQTAPAVPSSPSMEAAVPVIGETSAVPLEAVVYLDVATAMLILWIIGALAVIAYAAWKNFRFVRGAKKDAVLVETDCVLPVYLSEYISSPCLCGILKPVILVNDETLLSDAHFSMALRHELTHYHSGDRFWALLRLVCCAVHWFNPLVWIAAKVSVQDCERACDHRVLKGADQSERETYGELLLSYLKKPAAGYSLLCASSPMGGDKRALRGRIALIGKKPVTKKLAAVVLAVCVGVTCLVACTGKVESNAEYLQKLSGDLSKTEEVNCLYMLDENGRAQPTTISGKTLANYLNVLDLTEDAEAEKTADNSEHTGSDPSVIALFYCDADKAAYPIDITVVKEESDYTLKIYSEDGESVNKEYRITEEDAWAAWAMGRIPEDGNFRSLAVDGEELVMVSTDAVLGAEKHYFFRGSETAGYAYVESNLNDLVSCAAGMMVFPTEELGFLSFSSEASSGLQPPHLYRTEDGGVTWTRVELPIGGISADGGYYDIYVSGIWFEDEKNGEVTVSCRHEGTTSLLSSTYLTNDGGKTFGSIHTSPNMSVEDMGNSASMNHLSLELGASCQLPLPEGVESAVWESEQPAVAAMDETGTVTALRLGTATVSAEANGVRYEWNVFSYMGDNENWPENLDYGLYEEAVETETLKQELCNSITFDEESCMFTFTIPERMDASRLDLRVWGIARLANGQSRLNYEFMQNAVWTAGESYTFYAGEEDWDPLIMELSYPADCGITRQINLFDWIS